MAGTKRQKSQPPARRAQVIGAQVRVVARRGYIVEGLCLDAWELTNGGIALKVKPSDGSNPLELTTLDAVVVISDAIADSG